MHMVSVVSKAPGAAPLSDLWRRLVWCTHVVSREHAAEHDKVGTRTEGLKQNDTGICVRPLPPAQLGSCKVLLLVTSTTA